MLIQQVKEILEDQAHIFQDTYFQNFQIHQVTIMYLLNKKIMIFS